MAKTENGYFLIADISGYTQYLSDSELEHAHEVLQTLMELLIQHTRPPLIISRLAGDAVISYGLRDQFLQAQTFFEMIEDTYVAFRHAIDLMVMNNTCQCHACANISNLDLKFFVHYGEFTRQKLDQHDELLGADVVVIHRLLKNHVTEKTGCRAYALFTNVAIRQLGIESPEHFLREHFEQYEHVGEIKVWIQNMHPVWKTRQEAMRIEIPREQISVQESAWFPVPVEVVWDMLADPQYRSPFMNAVKQNVLHRQHGRIVPGSAFQCFHGDGRVTMQTVLEWRPFEQMTTEDTTPVPKTTVLIQFRLTPSETGTTLSALCGKARGPWLNRTICDLIAKSAVSKVFKTGFVNLHALLEKDMAAGKYTLPQPEKISLREIRDVSFQSLNPT
ncbi:MAG: DUF2652 domain-containing protein [Anaerolineales bacterium]|nr:DUF2652 domain-containing protein [Anaerolineales bacterium]